MTGFRWGSATDAGRVRTVNQDNSLVVDGRLFALADGMGGHQGGEVAAEVALTVLGENLTEHTTGDLLDAVREANRRVHEKAGADPDLAGMGTTLCAVALVESMSGEQKLALVNVGDSRVYRQRGADLEQLTEDHSLVASLVREGRLSEDEAATHPQRNVLTRALGIDVYVQVDSWELDVVSDDRYLLCSDGLFNEVEESRISATLRRFDEPTDAARELVRLANESGGRDNITCVVVDVLDGPTLAGRSPLGASDTDVHPVVPPLDPEDAPDETEAPSDEDPAASESPDDQASTAAGAVEADPDDEEDDVDVVVDDVDDGPVVARPWRFTWRVFVFGLALIALLVATGGAVTWYGRNTYFVSFDADEVVIFKGRPGGFLWFEPTLEERSGIDRRDVPSGVVDELAAGRDQATLGDAQRYVANLQEQVDSVTTTTTTTTTSTTTTAPPGPARAP